VGAGQPRDGLVAKPWTWLIAVSSAERDLRLLVAVGQFARQ
jgi:hypothetical protein